LIRLYPEQLWSEASILIGLLTAIFAVVILVGSVWWVRRAINDTQD
jgi:heme/copper-type cytochrome/quinol oxidase subunit 4